MKEEIRTLVRISTIFALLAFVILVCLDFEVLDSASYAITGAVAFSALFNYWIWKCPLLHSWFVPIPNLSGNWKCVIGTKYEGKDKKIIAKVSIKQTFTSIHVIMETKESKSVSKNGLIEINKAIGQTILTYVYENIPNVQIRDRSQIHFGAVRLEVKDNNCVEGEYWSDRKTVGTLEMKRDE